MKLNKIILGAFAILFAASVSSNVNASTVKANADGVVISVDPKKTEISASELPAAVKEAITKGEFAKWSIAKAYKITYDEGEMDEATTNQDQDVNDQDEEATEDTEAKVDAKVEYEVHYMNAQEEKEIEVYNATGEVVED